MMLPLVIEIDRDSTPIPTGCADIMFFSEIRILTRRTSSDIPTPQLFDYITVLYSSNRH